MKNSSLIILGCLAFLSLGVSLEARSHTRVDVGFRSERVVTHRRPYYVREAVPVYAREEPEYVYVEREPGYVVREVRPARQLPYREPVVVYERAPCREVVVVPPPYEEQVVVSPSLSFSWLWSFGRR